MNESSTRPWQKWLLIAWIGGVGAYYYVNFSSAFFRANEGSINSLLNKLF
ncbi:MAG: hypothetical protein VCD00_11145 [Candidatus Hydrogenedentota bacterium]